MRLRPGAEHARHRSRLRHTYIHNALEPVRARRSLVVRQLRRHLSRPHRATRSAATAPTPICSSTSRAARGSGATSTRASRARCSSTPTRRSRSWRSPRREPWYVDVLPAVRPPVHVRREHRHAARRRCRPAGSPGTRPGSRSRWTTGAPTRRRGDRFTTVMTWQIESFTDVGGNKDQEFMKFIDLPSRTPQPFELAINGPQQLLREHGWDDRGRDERLAHAVGLPRLHPAARRPSSASPSTPTSPHRSGWFSDRTECYLASGRPALVQDTGWTAHLPAGDGLLAFSTHRRGDGRHRPHQRRLRRARARGRARSPREHFDAARVLPRAARDVALRA